MERILVSCVGGTDPAGPQGDDGPILTLLEHLNGTGQRPGKVVLLTTETAELRVGLQNGKEATYKQAGMEENARRVAGEIRRRFQKLQVDTRLLPVDPSNVDAVIGKLVEQLTDLARGEVEFDVNITSGTPAMGTALTFLVDSGFLPRAQLWQVLNPSAYRDASGALLSVPRVRAVRLDERRERARLDRALALLRAMAFSGAKEGFELIAQRSLLPERRPRASAAAQLAEAYDLWDRAEFEQAYEGLHRAAESLRNCGLGQVADTVSQQVTALEQICASFGYEGHRTEDLPLLEDIYASILRRQRARLFMSVATRARRLYEGILNFFIYESGLDPEGLTADALDAVEEAGQQIRDLLKRERNVDVQQRPAYAIGDLWVRVRVAEILADHGLVGWDDRTVNGEGVRNLERLYRAFDDVRNDSYEEHGLAAVSEEDAERVVGIAGEMMEIVTGQVPRGHPFAPAAIDGVAARLEEAL